MKLMYLLVGHISLALGTLGFFFPILPTTPFLLLSAFCYMRGSKKMHHWLINHKLFGEYISNYQKKQISRKHRRNTLIVLYIGIGISVYLIQKTPTSIILPLIALGVTIHLFQLKGVD